MTRDEQIDALENLGYEPDEIDDMTDEEIETESKIGLDDNGDECERCGQRGEVASYYSGGRYRSLCECCAMG